MSELKDIELKFLNEELAAFCRNYRYEYEFITEVYKPIHYARFMTNVMYRDETYRDVIVEAIKQHNKSNNSKFSSSTHTVSAGIGYFLPLEDFADLFNASFAVIITERSGGAQ